MKIDIITLFPKMFDYVLNESIIKRAQKSGRVSITAHNLRDWTCDKHRTVDDKPFGGGAGMVMKPEPIFEAIASLRGVPLRKCCRGEAGRRSNPKTRIVLLTPQGKKLDQKSAKRLSKYKHLILICGHYEGVDERVRRHLATDEISIGDYVLTGGELPAMVLIDSVIRLIPNVLGHKDSARFESFEKGLLEYPHYTRPAEYRRMKVPKVLLSGNHSQIESWRKEEAVRRTKKRRPDLSGGN
ncbi:MAG: tRNA (guanosine(37)-N1)-methyltransferase TrmD [Candidatus Omnitrophica bacterium]|nr:tRNA (guanosine(37)-N1)-methyltransferase TrmD [Candidatus Omnitrophota bacterium]